MDPSEGETEEPTRVGRWRPLKEPYEPQTAVKEEKVKEYNPQEKDRVAAVSRAAALQEVVPSCIKNSLGPKGWRPARKNEASNDERKAKLNKLTQKLPSARCRQPRVKRVNWADDARKLVRDPRTVNGVLGSGNLVNVKPLCDPKESLSHDIDLGNSTCVAGVCFYEPNLDDSVVSDCDDTHSYTDDAIPASCTPDGFCTWCVGQTFFLSVK